MISSESGVLFFTMQVCYFIWLNHLIIIKYRFLSSLSVCLFSSVLRYAPNPGGGSVGRTCSRQQRNPPCSICVNSGLPILDQVCPFHHQKTEGLVGLMVVSMI